MAAAKYVTPSTAADQLLVSERTLRRWIAAGELPAYRVGPRQIRIAVDDLDALMRRIPTTESA
jgi:excisionase family DNA binding protein